MNGASCFYLTSLHSCHIDYMNLEVRMGQLYFRAITNTGDKRFTTPIMIKDWLHKNH